MQKRLVMPAMLLAAVFYVAFAVSPVRLADYTTAKRPESASMNVSGESDMLPVSRSMPLLKQSTEASELFALIGSYALTLVKAAALALILFVLLCDAHSKLRALKIQTARWCAS